MTTVGGTTAPRATLIYLADEEVGCRLSSLPGQFFPTLILGRADSFWVFKHDLDRALTKGLSLVRKERSDSSELCQRHTHKGALTFYILLRIVSTTTLTETLARTQIIDSLGQALEV